MSGKPGTIELNSVLTHDLHLAVIYVDAEGVIRSWNRAAELIFGHAADNAIGQRSDLIVPDSLREMHWTGFNRALGTRWRGSDGWGPIEPLHENGQTLELEVFLVALCEGPDPEATGVLALFRRMAPRSG